MLNGRHDEDTPYLTNALPLWNLLREPKELIVVDGGHLVPLEVRVPAINGCAPWMAAKPSIGFKLGAMPVTARLLQRLHEALGDEATNDLFSWWEEAATVNRAAVREVADLYFARFDARLEKGLAEVRSELASGLAAVRSEMANQRADLIKWMFIFWVGTVVPLAGLVIALTKL